jgi:hypothetical protein
MVPAEILSGNLIVDNKFYDGEELIFEFKVKIFYV